MPCAAACPALRARARELSSEPRALSLPHLEISIACVFGSGEASSVCVKQSLISAPESHEMCHVMCHLRGLAADTQSQKRERVSRCRLSRLIFRESSYM